MNTSQGKTPQRKKELFSQRVLLPQEQVGINSSWNVVSLESRRKLPIASEVMPWKTLSKKSSARDIWLQWSYLAYEKYPITFSWVLQCLTQGCSVGKVFQRGIEPSSSQPSNIRCLGANLLPLHPSSLFSLWWHCCWGGRREDQGAVVLWHCDFWKAIWML